MGTILKRLDFKQRYPGLRQGLFLVRNEKRLPKDQTVVNIGRIVSEQLVDCPREKRAGKDRFEQVLIRSEDIAYVVKERVLSKTKEQKAMIHRQVY